MPGGQHLPAQPLAPWPVPEGRAISHGGKINHGQGHSEHPAHTQSEKRPRGPGRREPRPPLLPSLQVVLDRTGAGGAAVWPNSGAT